MSQVEELESRITSALDRIAKGVETLGAESGGVDTEELEKVRSELEDEKLVSAQLEERIKALHEKQDARFAELKANSTLLAMVHGEELQSYNDWAQGEDCR